MNNVSIALTAPMPSKTAPKLRAAKIIHINIQDTPSVFFKVFSITFHLSLPLNKAAKVAPKAPTAEHSTKLAIPIKKSPVIEKKIANGIKPACKSLNFSDLEICLSCFGSAGPSSGCSLHLM